MFTVKVPKTDNVSILKKLLKEEKAPHLNHVAASDLDLWKVSFPIDDLILKTLTTPGPKLRPERLLSEVFSVNLDINCIHVVVRALGIGEYYIDFGLNFLFIILSRRTIPWFVPPAVRL
jgi:hypothetical protein